MSRFFSHKYDKLKAYVPGEQPRDMQYVKLNTNESPYPPSQSVIDAAKQQAGLLNLYSDPEITSLTEQISKIYGVSRSNVICTNGSDEALNFAFMAFCDQDRPIAFPDITYGFYPVFAELNNIPYEEIPLCDDFTINVDDYCSCGKNVVIANPNAPTGIALSLDKIERIIASNPDNIVIIDEAYVDFGSDSAVSLINKYSNLIVVQTFSKSRSMAGARLGFAIANEELIRDMNTLRFSTNPYNVNRMTMACGVAALVDNDYYMENCKQIIKTRESTKAKLIDLGFEVLDSSTNFLFVKNKSISGERFYKELKARGVLVRHFSKDKITEYNRVTIGTPEQMECFINVTKEILGEL
ncbi:MAG: histidinol-phosphate transaminase [Clostridiales bacterium]|nr:histidinol-phosphate transaminase [Clostridiales bacterium]